MKQETLLTAVVGGGFAAIVQFLFGAWTAALTTLFMFLVLDFITGVLSACYSGTVTKEKALKGAWKKVGLVALILVANQLDIMIGTTEFSIRDVAVWLLVAGELVSITSNLKELGIEIPDIVMAAVGKVTDKLPKRGT